MKVEHYRVVACILADQAKKSLLPHDYLLESIRSTNITTNDY